LVIVEDAVLGRSQFVEFVQINDQFDYRHARLVDEHIGIDPLKQI